MTRQVKLLTGEKFEYNGVTFTRDKYVEVTDEDAKYLESTGRFELKAPDFPTEVKDDKPLGEVIENQAVGPGVEPQELKESTSTKKPADEVTAKDVSTKGVLEVEAAVQEEEKKTEEKKSKDKK